MVGGSVSKPAAPSRPPAQCRSAGQPIPCSVSGAYWSSGFGCYVTPQPVDPAKAGFSADLVAAHESESLHQCIPYNLIDGGQGVPAQGYYRWIPAGTPTAAYIDPAVLARTAIEQMNLRAVEIGMAPPSGTLGLVGLPVHLWANNPGNGTWTATRTVTAGTVSVTAVAAVEKVVWNLGDGSTMTCGAGTPYEASRGAAPSPDCGHTYTRTSAGRPGGAYAVTATSHWVVRWTSNTGAGDDIDLDLSATATLRIGESQVIVTRG